MFWLEMYCGSKEIWQDGAPKMAYDHLSRILFLSGCYLSSSPSLVFLLLNFIQTCHHCYDPWHKQITSYFISGDMIKLFETVFRKETGNHSRYQGGMLYEANNFFVILIAFVDNSYFLRQYLRQVLNNGSCYRSYCRKYRATGRPVKKLCIGMLNVLLICIILLYYFPRK